jgi:hypothetical protein
VLSGRAVAAFADGQVIELNAGELFYVSPEPHDSWVVGEEPYVSLHLMGAGHYAKERNAPGVRQLVEAQQTWTRP